MAGFAIRLCFDCRGWLRPYDSLGAPWTFLRNLMRERAQREHPDGKQYE
jgi:hypothetical protein